MISNSTKNKVTKALTACVLALGLLVGFREKTANAASGKVLILASSVSGGAGSVEATQAGILGYGVDVVTSAAWAAMTTADFAQYRAIILGDPTCSTSPTGNMGAAEANTAVWGPAVTGNVIVFGTDEVFHGKTQVTYNGISFAAAGTSTGLFVSLSCYYVFAPTVVPVLSYFGAFMAEPTPAGCFAPVHIIASHPALAGLTDAYLTGWGCSTHETFASFPTSTFVPLAIAIGPGVGAITSPDGVTGVPYILARGAIPVLCGDGTVQATEGCDHGASNGACGDTCSSICKLHWCGDGVSDTGEECDLGCANGAPGSACSATCKTVAVATPTPPSCALTGVVAGPPKELDITVQDSDDGIATIEVTDSANATVLVPPFSSAEKGALVVTALKIDQTAGAHVALKITDVGGNVTNCDPLVPGEQPTSLDMPSDSAGGCNVGRTNGAAGLSGLLGVLVGLALLRRSAAAQKK